MKTWDDDLEKVRGHLAVCLLHNQEQNRKMLVAEETRQQANMKQIEYGFQLQSLIEKLTDRVEALEKGTKLKEEVAAERSASRSKLYGPAYPGIWKMTEEGEMKQVSYGEFMMGQLLKRPPSKSPK